MKTFHIEYFTPRKGSMYKTVKAKSRESAIKKARVKYIIKITEAGAEE